MRKYFDTVIDPNGDVIQGASVAVTTAGGALVQLYRDAAGTGPVTNPINKVSTDSLGLYSFFIPDGTYTISYSYGSGPTVTVTDVTIGSDDRSFVQEELNAGHYFIDLGQGTYTITADNIDTSQFYGFAKNAQLTSVMPGDSLIRAKAGNIIGLSYNHKLVHTYTGSYPSASPGSVIVSGNLQAPPISTAEPSSIDIAAHWYGDWGLDWYRRQTGIGSAPFYNWYDGSWNWETNNTATSEHGIYDPSRRSILGSYRNDDPNVLDWQCYWLREAGVKAVIPVAFDLELATWGNSNDRNLWLYRLFNTPNFQGLSYIPWARSTDFTDPDGAVTATTGQILAQWQSLWNSLAPAYPNNYALSFGGKKWFTVYVWNAERLRALYDPGGGSTNFSAFLAARAAEVIALGYGGLAVLSNTAVTNGTMNRDALLTNSVLHMPSPYGGPAYSNTVGATTYSDIVDAYAPPVSGSVLTVSTALQYVAPLPPSSFYSFPNSTPALFGKLARKAISWLKSHPLLPQLLTVYNVSEWAEGGPGLHPNKRDGFGYLDALREAAGSVVSPGGTLRTPITLLAGWTNAGGGNQVASCWKSSCGTVHISGVITGGTTTANTIIGQLPAGFWPSASEQFAVYISGGGGFINVEVDGKVRALTTLNATITSLSGSFLAAS